MGFNTIRKHIKIDPARWYYHADRLGIMVWQDFVNPKQDLPEGSKQAFEQQGKEMMEQLHNHPSITTWVLFNEKWGAYDQQRLTEWIKRSDPSRLVNGHFGELLWVNEQLRSPSRMHGSAVTLPMCIHTRTLSMRRQKKAVYRYWENLVHRRIHSRASMAE
jgi:beta-galactosidase/beta-glucuronidase